MNFFAQLREHAQSRPDAIAVASRYRDVTYRKLWSRVERATARFQTEWGLADDMAIGYAGPAHPDALVAFIAAMRCGALFIPLETPALRLQAPSLLRELDARILLVEDAADYGPASPSMRTEETSALIGVRCPHQPFAVVEDPARRCLLRVAIGADGELLRSGYSLNELLEGKADAPPQPCHIAGGLFEPPVLERAVLPTLLAGGELRLS